MLAPTKKAKSPIHRFFSLLGPGLVSGAADDDPSGIVTYSIAGALLGTTLLWTALITFPLLAAVQMMCARIGMVTGEGLAGALKRKFPRWLLIVATVALFSANAVNIGADLSGMADAANVLSGLPTPLFVCVFGIGIICASIWLKYTSIASVLKWLSFSLFAYVITAFLCHPNWPQVLPMTFCPSWPRSHDEWSTLVALLGTTISPSLFFWQASQEVEIGKSEGKVTVESRQGVSALQLRDRAIDVGTGTLYSNVIMYFVILTTALTLHKNGITHLKSSKDAIQALEPLAGHFATWLYAIGLIGVGLLAIPTLAGSTAYAFCECFDFSQGLNENLARAKAFYATMALSTIAGIALTFSGINPMDALFWSSVINGLLAPFLLVGILLVASDKKLMQNSPSSILGRVVVAIATLGMFGAGIALFVL